ncbi:T5orf172 domain-containing protein [Nitrosomonas ureae]|uniref:GIY-YIG nuclease family protein n=1 Tax=Nitrosomonas ureae TaxID=44577 RepID=UPI000D7543DD|nr:GIY-YIG nuclease family protein [Nitrosomonas ureae]PXX16099.1 T5orf172 domain-containing protein [Nitrosomonas ureae]
MAKTSFTDEDDALLAELGVEVEVKSAGNRTPREERIIAGFEDIERFFEQHGRAPMHGEDRDIFERLYAVRLDRIRDSEECRAVLADKDKHGHGLLTGEPITAVNELDNLDDDALLSELGVLDSGENDITKLTYVKSRAEIKAAEEVAKRTPCLDFDTFKPLFAKVQEELASGIRLTRKFQDDALIRQGDFFILGGQKVYVAEIGVEFIAEYGRPDRRLRVIYDNGTESDILMRSLQRALNRDETSRRIIDTFAGPLFSNVTEDGDRETGTIYVLRSKSDHPLIKEHRDVIHKIGVTSGSIEKRIINAKLDPTFLMAEVEIVASYELSNINQVKLENLIHRFFEPAKLDIEIMDRFGNPVVPREWFLVPLHIIDEAIEKIRDGSIVNFRYDPVLGKIIE